MSQGRAPSPFVPRCPACRYDLTGIPEGVCPECGTPFQLSQLHQAWFVRQMKRRIDPRWMLAVCILFAVLSFPPLTWPARPVAVDINNGLWCMVVGTLAAVWLIADRTRVFQGRGLYALWLAIPITYITLTLALAYRYATAFEFEFAAAVGAIVSIIAWWLTPRRRLAPLLAAMALIVAAPGTLFGPVWLAMDWWWTPFSDPRAGTAQIYSQYPLNRIEIAPYAWAVFLAGVGLMMLAIISGLWPSQTADETADD